MSSMSYHIQVWHDNNQPHYYCRYTIFMIIFVFIMFPLTIGIQLGFAQSMQKFTDILLILPTAAFCITFSLIAINHTKIIELSHVVQQVLFVNENSSKLVKSNIMIPDSQHSSIALFRYFTYFIRSEHSNCLRIGIFFYSRNKYKIPNLNIIIINYLSSSIHLSADT